MKTQLTLATANNRAFIISNMYQPDNCREWELRPVKSKHHKTPTAEETRQMAQAIVGVFGACQIIASA